MVKKYRQKKIIVEAAKFDGSNIDDMRELSEKCSCIAGMAFVQGVHGEEQHVCVGDYLVKREIGLFVCSDGLFNETFEACEDTENSSPVNSLKISVEVDGLDEFEQKLDRITAKAERLTELLDKLSVWLKT